MIRWKKINSRLNQVFEKNTEAWEAKNRLSWKKLDSNFDWRQYRDDVAAGQPVTGKNLFHVKDVVERRHLAPSSEGPPSEKTNKKLGSDKDFRSQKMGRDKALGSETMRELDEVDHYFAAGRGLGRDKALGSETMRELDEVDHYFAAGRGLESEKKARGDSRGKI